MSGNIRNTKYQYRLLVDPDRLTLGNNIQGWLLNILVKAGGTMDRVELVRQFSAVLKRQRPKNKLRPSTLLSHHQRVLRDQGIIQIQNANGVVITTTPRSKLLQS